MPKRVITQTTYPSTIYVGIDPGKGGGIVAIDAKRKVLAVKAMPVSERDQYEALKSLSFLTEDNLFAALEKISPGFPGTAKGSMSKLYGHYCLLRGFLIARDIVYETVTPGRWQHVLGLRKKKKSETKVAWKNYLKGEAQRLFPRHRVTLGVSDAFLLAEFCRRWASDDEV